MELGYSQSYRASRQALLVKTLGRGSFSKVVLSEHLLTGELAAVKIMDKYAIKDRESLTRISRELSILKSISHPFIAEFYQIFETDRYLYAVMEFCERGELFNLIVKEGRLLEEYSAFLFHQIVEAMFYLHELGVAHRDVKPENILIDTNDQIKLIDFGLSNVSVNRSLFGTPCGSPCYAPPEMINKMQYDGRVSDVWSLGITLFAMVTGRRVSPGCVPFEDDELHLLYDKILDGKFYIPPHCSKDLRRLLRQMICTDPESRITLTEIRY